MGAFSLDLSRFVAKAKGRERLVVRKIVIDVGSSVVLKTPVGDPDQWNMPAPAGYVGGRARGSWQYAKGSPMAGEPGGVDPGGAGAIGRVVGGAMAGDPLVEHYLTSNVPYMRRLEYEGWSKQAPEGMVRLTIEEFQRFVDDAARSLP